MITEDQKQVGLDHLNTSGLPCPTNHAGLVWTEYQWEGVPFLIGECADCGGTCAAGGAESMRAIVRSWTYRNTMEDVHPLRMAYKRSELYWKRVEAQR